jgi:hypothetical protein
VFIHTLSWHSSILLSFALNKLKGSQIQDI